MHTIQFVFEGVAYTAPSSFYDTNLAILPDGRVVRASGWLESFPPRPTDLKLVPCVSAAKLDPNAA